jgi:hypothetical protein
MTALITREELEQEIAAGSVTVVETLGPAYYEDAHLPARSTSRTRRSASSPPAAAGPRRRDRHLLLEHRVPELGGRGAAAGGRGLHERPQVRGGQAGLGRGRPADGGRLHSFFPGAGERTAFLSVVPTQRPALTRRSFLHAGALASGALALGPGFWQRALAAPATVTDGPYGPLLPPDANGIRLPKDFRSRLVARAFTPVQGVTPPYVFPRKPDGQATFATAGGGFILVTNAEAGPVDGGGASAIRFDRDGAITDAYRILSNTRSNCSGGPTPWGTWLSCEEYDNPEEGRGAVFECDPSRASQGVRLPSLGLFNHEAACVDPAGQQIYLTEDASDGGLYRFTPEAYPDLTRGLLEVMVDGGGGRVGWARVPNPTPAVGTPGTKKQVPGMRIFRRGEGLWFDSGVVYVATTTDSAIHAYDTRSGTLETIYAKADVPNPPLTDVDNITVSPSGDLFACEDNGEADGIDIALLTPDRTVSRFLSLVGPQHDGSEAAGPIFDPSGTRFYFTSQRARGPSWTGEGAVYEITGPFRLERPAGRPRSRERPRTRPAVAAARPRVSVSPARPSARPGRDLARRPPRAGARRRAAAADRAHHRAEARRAVAPHARRARLGDGGALRPLPAGHAPRTATPQAADAPARDRAPPRARRRSEDDRVRARRGSAVAPAWPPHPVAREGDGHDRRPRRRATYARPHGPAHPRAVGLRPAGRPALTGRMHPIAPGLFNVSYGGTRRR